MDNNVISIYGHKQYYYENQVVRPTCTSLGYNNVVDTAGDYVIHQDSSTLRIIVGRTQSICLERLANISIHVEGRAKHILLLDCSSISMTTTEPPLAGVYCLRCTDLSIRIIEGEYNLNYAAVESVSDCHIYGNLNTDFLFTSFGSINVSVNGLNTIATGFNSFTMRLNNTGGRAYGMPTTW